jgi:hypothetical protein
MSANGFSAPGSEHDFGIGAADIVRRYNALGSGADVFSMRKDVVAAGAFNQFADPAYAGDQWIIPFLEVNARAGGDAFERERGGSRNSWRSCAASRSRLTTRPSNDSVASISVRVRWFVARTERPRLMSSAESDACTSENVTTRSGSSAMISSKRAVLKELTRG